jgi:2-polyprenyl-3-methyl-5-hydroxy-6-metoxy-1,4-benzoquinol methylase
MDDQAGTAESAAGPPPQAGTAEGASGSSPRADTATPPLLTAEEAAAYWDSRHRKEDDLRSGGHIGLDHGANEMFYARRLGTLLEITGDGESRAEPLFVLDAGCGKGYFARALARCGHRVDAIDASPSAIAYCSSASAGTAGPDTPAGHAGVPSCPPPPRWAVSPLADWTNGALYDVVYSIDVFFHILDDAAWSDSLANLASLVRYGGKLVVTDEDCPQRQRRGRYILHRPAGEYTAFLAPYGFTHLEFRPYRFRDNLVGFHVFTRTH